MRFIVSCHECRNAFKHIHGFSFYILLLCRKNRRLHGFFHLFLCVAMQHGLYLFRRYLSDTTSGQFPACPDDVCPGKTIFPCIVQQQDECPVVILEIAVIQSFSVLPVLFARPQNEVMHPVYGKVYASSAPA